MKKLYTLLVASFMAATAFSQITLVEDINPGANGCTFGYPYVSGNYIYFRADDKDATVDHGSELWRSNGTTTELIDLKIGTGVDSKPAAFFELNNKIYFSAQAPTSNLNYQWEYDPSSEEATNIASYNFYSTSITPVVFNNKAYFGVWNDSYHLYEFDGVNPPQQVEDKAETATDEYVSNLTLFNGDLILYMKTANEASSIGTELYKYDFSTNLYTLIKDIDEGTGSSSISYFAEVGNLLYFEADNYLWVTDGTTNGTVAVSATNNIAGVKSLYEWNNILYFEGDTDDSSEDYDQLYAYDPSNGTLTQLSNTTDDHDPDHFAEPGDGYLYYAGKNDDGIAHLFRTDGSVVEEVYPNGSFSGIDDMVVMNSTLYFEATDANNTIGSELYSLDPSTITANDVATGIADELYVKNLSIYPNPTNGIINITGLESVEATYTVYDIAGRMVKTGSVTKQISLNIAAGIYILEVKDGDYTTTHKIQVK